MEAGRRPQGYVAKYRVVSFAAAPFPSSRRIFLRVMLSMLSDALPPRRPQQETSIELRLLDVLEVRGRPDYKLSRRKRGFESRHSKKFIPGANGTKFGAGRRIRA